MLANCAFLPLSLLVFVLSTSTGAPFIPEMDLYYTLLGGESYLQVQRQLYPREIPYVRHAHMWRLWPVSPIERSYAHGLIVWWTRYAIDPIVLEASLVSYLLVDHSELELWFATQIVSWGDSICQVRLFVGSEQPLHRLIIRHSLTVCLENSPSRIILIIISICLSQQFTLSIIEFRPDFQVDWHIVGCQIPVLVESLSHIGHIIDVEALFNHHDFCLSCPVVSTKICDEPLVVVGIAPIAEENVNPVGWCCGQAIGNTQSQPSWNTLWSKQFVILVVIVVKAGLGDSKTWGEHVIVIFWLQISWPTGESVCSGSDSTLFGWHVENLPEPEHQVVNVKCTLSHIQLSVYFFRKAVAVHLGCRIQSWFLLVGWNDILKVTHVGKVVKLAKGHHHIQSFFLV